MNITTVATLAVACLATGCVNWTPSVSAQSTYDPQQAYLYGDFALDAKENAFGQYLSMGLNIKCEGGATYMIRLRRPPTLQVIALKPDNCTADELIFANIDNVEKSRKPLTLKYATHMALAPGGVYYLGDFNGEASVTVDGGMVHTRWRITSLRDRYTQTTEAMRATFPSFAKVATHNLMAAPAAASATQP